MGCWLYPGQEAAVGSREWKRLAGQEELGGNKGIFTFCAFPFELVVWATQKFKAERQMCLHTQIIYSSSLIGNPMISGTISQLFSRYSLPTGDALAGKGGQHPHHPTAAKQSSTSPAPALREHSQNHSASQASPRIAPMWVPWLQQPPRALSASRLEKPRLLLGVTHTGEWEQCLPAASASTPQMSQREHYSLQLPN